jgi:hypothetical protein
MFLWMPDSVGDLVFLKVIGKLNDADYRETLPRLIEVALREGSLRLVADLSEFEGVEWHLAYEQSAFGKPYWGKLKRVALVGTQGWTVLAARIAADLAPADVRIFDAGKGDAALKWAKSDVPDPAEVPLAP